MRQQQTPHEEMRLEALQQRICDARTFTPDLVNEAIDKACPRLAVLTKAQATVRRMIEAGALTDAVLAAIELELPQWKLRRLIYEDGEWYCSLSKQPWLPLGLDEVAEATHELLPLAILMALIEARRLTFLRATTACSVPQVKPAEMYVMCCDNCV